MEEHIIYSIQVNREIHGFYNTEEQAMEAKEEIINSYEYKMQDKDPSNPLITKVCEHTIFINKNDQIIINVE